MLQKARGVTLHGYKAIAHHSLTCIHRATQERRGALSIPRAREASLVSSSRLAACSCRKTRRGRKVENSQSRTVSSQLWKLSGRSASRVLTYLPTGTARDTAKYGIKGAVAKLQALLLFHQGPHTNQQLHLLDRVHPGAAVEFGPPAPWFRGIFPLTEDEGVDQSQQRVLARQGALGTRVSQDTSPQKPEEKNRLWVYRI